MDGAFDSGDLIAIFEAGEYEDDIAQNSTWATGDWNGDREFDSGDLIAAFADGGYDAGPLAVAGATSKRLAKRTVATITVAILRIIVFSSIAF